MKRTFALMVLMVVLVATLIPVMAFAAEVVAEDGFNPEALVVGGVALAPLISIVISVLKGWVKMDGKYIPLINVVLGAVAVAVVAVVNQGMAWSAALVMTLGVVLGSQVFHETFGHAAKIIGETFAGKPQEE